MSEELKLATKQESDELPAILFDGKAVYDEINRYRGLTHCHSVDAVSATLDAVVRLMRRDAATSAPPAVPEGFVIVPIEPTPEMLYAPHTIIQAYGAKLIYQRMIAAAPVALAA